MSTDSTQSLQSVQSAAGYLWQFRDCTERDVLTLQQKLGVSEIIARILLGRGIDLQTAPNYLEPKLKNAMPDPFHYLDMQRAVERLTQAINDNEKIAIFGDYDVDGATSSALLKRYFDQLNIQTQIHIPDRIEEGYGPNEQAIQKLYNDGCKILITVDCGTVSYGPLEYAAKIGFDTIVVDHHIGGDTLPDAVAVINPNRKDETTKYNNLAAVGVCFMLLAALTKHLREQGHFNNANEPSLINLLDLVALGTVCDVMQLTGVNRAFVTQGLKVMQKRQNIGIAELIKTAYSEGPLECYHLGFVLGPRINAGGRVGKADLGSKLLTTNDGKEAAIIAEQLNQYNQERQAIEHHVLEQAMEQAETQQHLPVIMCIGEGWHPGIVGIVASRVKEKFYKPTAVISLEDGICKASSRSITGVDLGTAIANAKAADLLIAGGGHAMAAGFTYEHSKHQQLHDYLINNLQKQVEQNSDKILKLDAKTSVGALNEATLDEIERAKPFGNGNSEPRFYVSKARLVMVQVLKDKHIKCIFDGGITGTKHRCYAMSFNSIGTKMGDLLQNGKGKSFNLAVRLKANHWNGRRRADVMLDDLVLSD